MQQLVVLKIVLCQETFHEMILEIGLVRDLCFISNSGSKQYFVEFDFPFAPVSRFTMKKIFSKTALRGCILNVLTHTTAWYHHWGGCGTLKCGFTLKVSLASFGCYDF